MKYRLFLSLLCLFAMSSNLVTAQTIKTLNPLISFGTHGDGSIQPGDSPWVDSADMNQRGIAYDPVTGNVVYVNTHSGSGGSAFVQGTIEVLDGTTGAEISTLNTNGISGGNYADLAAAVADDGAVYICNQVTASSTNPFKIYRWSSVTSTDPPVVAFSGTLSPSQRYGASIDIRGAGTGTQIIIGSMPGGTGTNVVIFTTADGTNFTATVLATDATSANFNDGIAFGPGNTFWAKRIGAPLRYMSFNLTTSNAVTVATYTTTNSAVPANLGPIAVDLTNNVLAGIELVGGTVTSAPERVWLFDISDTNKPPSVLAYRDFSLNNQNSTAPLGYLDFGSNRLYAAVTRNGILASSVDTVPMPPPIITKDLQPTNRVALGQTAHFEVQAYPSITGYQWFLNGSPIVNQTNYFLDVANVQTNDNGKVYNVRVSNPAGNTLSSNSVLAVVNPSDLYHLNLLWRAAPGAAPGPTNWYTGTGGGTPTERTIAYNALSNQLYVVFRNGNNLKVSVIDPGTGYLLYTLKTNGITNAANIPLCAIGVANDGAIYASSSVGTGANAFNEFKVYRWENSDPNTFPSNVFVGNPAPDVTSASYRWGDVLDVRGSGTSTEIIFDNQNGVTAGSVYVALLQPTDSTMSAFSGKGYVLQNLPNGPGGGAGGNGIGRSIQFGEGDTFWQKRWAAGGAPLAQSSYDRGLPGTVAPLVVSSSGQPLYTNGPIGINLSLKLAAAINFANSGSAATVPDTLDLYDLTSPTTPVLLNRYNFPINAAANANRIGQVIFTTNYVFAIDANNGVMAFQVAAGPIPPPTFLTQPRNTRIIQGGSATLNVILDQGATITWFKDGVSVGSGNNFAISNAQPVNAGNYWATAVNANGSATSTVAVVSIGLTNDNYTLSSFWTKAPGTALGTDYVTSNGGANTPNERAFAYNAVSNQLLFVQCPVAGNPSSATPVVHVVDANTGTKVSNLRTDGFVSTLSEVSGSNPLNMLGIAASDDGAIYACNGTPNGSGGSDGATAKKFRVYRWADSDPNTPMTSVFEGDPSGQGPGVNVRWGDSLTARGGGVNTELLLDSNDGAYGAVLKPTDSSMTALTNDWFSASAPAGSIGRSLQFGQTNSLWQKRKGGNLNFSSYNITNHTSTQITNINFGSSTLGGVTVDTTRKLAVGVDFVGNATAPDALALYDISDISTPMLIARYNFPANQPGNANAICQTMIVGNKVYALDGNAGFAVFTIVPPVNSAPPQLQVSRNGSNINLSWTDASAILQSTTDLTTPITWTDRTTVGQTSFSESMAGGAKFYRLKK